MPDTIRPEVVEQLLVGRDLETAEATEAELVAVRSLLWAERDWYIDLAERIGRLLCFVRRFATAADRNVGDVLGGTPGRIAPEATVDFEEAAARLMADAFPGGIVWRDGGDPRDLTL